MYLLRRHNLLAEKSWLIWYWTLPTSVRDLGTMTHHAPLLSHAALSASLLILINKDNEDFASHSRLVVDISHYSSAEDKKAFASSHTSRQFFLTAESNSMCYLGCVSSPPASGLIVCLFYSSHEIETIWLHQPVLFFTLLKLFPNDCSSLSRHLQLMTLIW